MRMTFNKACEIIYNHYGKENVSQIRKPDHKAFYVVDFKDGTGIHLYKDDLEKMHLTKKQNSSLSDKMKDAAGRVSKGSENGSERHVDMEH